MMGRHEAGQAPLFYAFNLEDHVSKPGHSWCSRTSTGRTLRAKLNNHGVTEATEADPRG